MIGLRRIAVVAALVSACGDPNAAATRASMVRAHIDSMNLKTSRWWDAGLLDSIAGTYASDATMLEAHERPTRGRAAIRQRLFPGDMSKYVVHLRSVTEELRVADTIAVEKGRATIDVRSKVDTTRFVSRDRVNYVTVWVLRGGRWLILYDADFSELPVAPS